MEKNTLHTYKLVLLFACSLVLFLNTELSFLASAKTLDNDSKAFYLGERVHDDPELVTASHHEMLESLLESKEDAHNSMIYSYQHGFSGFAALLTSTQANKHYKKTARILREKIVGISSEYRYSDDIPTKQVVGNNSSEFLLSSEIPRNFPTEFRGNKFPRKFRGPFVCRKCPRNIPRENIVGIFPRTFIDRCVLDIYTSIDRNIPTEIFLGIFRGTCPSVYSEELVPRNIPREQFLEHPEVIHVIPNRILKLQTTRTWDHLGLSQISTPFSSSSSTSVKGLLHDTNMGSEAIIGVIDTGIWPESKVFNDQGLGPIPKRWRGKCVSGEKFNATIHCNKKLIGAKYYVSGLLAEMGGKFNRTIIQDLKSSRDVIGHGTHTATITGGSFVSNASYYGLAQGTVRGGAPKARIAAYKACWNGVEHAGGCTTADMWKAFDDAIHDGVDVLSVSIGGGIPEDSEVDKLDYIAAFHAVTKGIPVVAAAGNAGPAAQTVVNVAPWLLTVAATTLDRSFPTKITLGNNQTFLAESLYTGPEISTGLAFLDSNSDDNVDVKGKTVLVFDSIRTTPIRLKGVAGVIFARKPDDLLQRCHSFKCIFADYELGTDILQYIRTTRSPTVRINSATTLTGLPATTKVAAFSCRGPNSVSPAILKPDIAAPGVSILAALSPFDSREHDGFGLDTGTSMSTPVVSGIIALLKSLHPNWSPAAVRSALVTTGQVHLESPFLLKDQTRSLQIHLTMEEVLKLFGLVNPQRASKPGLVYDMGIQDYINYMCSAGYNDSSISGMVGIITKCPNPKPSILDMNLPSITIPNIEKEVTLTRTVTNVGPIKSVYKAVIESPLGITLTVTPNTLVFSSAAKRVLTFKVKAKTSHKVNTGYFFGSLTWTDGVHDVKIPVSVQTKIMIKA
ncbi:hypothetical protein DY000_02027019 [Brassica cretica]|uniref:Subtilisin-like protease fibronectin type-III domain-containing protein n=1 Tax=Brassica cretica TaxID=69181 RepID=A0ABQ7E0V5_BRACR|nr:hypothetical protein DY000_02027019 [Brassica cretica]